MPENNEENSVAKNEVEASVRLEYVPPEIEDLGCIEMLTRTSIFM